MTDWSKCSAVESVPGKVSGAWVFTDSRLPVSALFENLEAGATLYDFMEWFGGVEESEVAAVLEHVAQDLPGQGHPCESCSITARPISHGRQHPRRGNPRGCPGRPQGAPLRRHPASAMFDAMPANGGR